MASKLSSSFLDSSEMEYDFACTTCAESSLNREAAFHCDKCLKHFCTECDQLHGKLFREHSVVDRSKLSLWGAPKRTLAMASCVRHPNKDLELYCQDHDEVLCPVCVSVEHRSCQMVKHLPDVAKGIQKKPEFTKLLADLQTMKTSLLQLVSSLVNRKKSVEDSGKGIKSTIHSIRKRLNKFLDDIEQGTLVEVDKALVETKAVIQSDIDACKETCDEVDKLAKVFENKAKSSDEYAFVAMKKGEEVMAKSESLKNRISKKKHKIEFEENREMENALSSVEFFGTVSSLTRSYGAMLSDQVLKVKGTSQHNVMVNGYQSIPCITGACYLLNGNWVMIDFHNKKIKLFDEKFNHLDTMVRSQYVYDVCTATDGSDTVYVTEDPSHVLVINTSNNKLKLTKALILDHKCVGILLRSGQMYVTSHQELFIHSLDGKLVNKVYSDRTSPNSTFRFAISHDAENIFISNFDTHAVVSIDKRGNVLNTFTDPDLKNPYGILVMQSGHLIACGWARNTILQLDKDGKRKIAVLADGGHGIDKPISLSYDEKTSRLVVGQQHHTNIVVLRIQ